MSQPATTPQHHATLPRQRVHVSHYQRRRLSLHAVAQQPRSEGLRLIPVATVGLDMAAAAVAVVLASLLHPLLFNTGAPDDLVPGLEVAGPLVVLGWLLCLAVFGAYDRRVFGATSEEFSRVLRAGFGCAALVGVGSYLARFDLSRGWFALMFVLGTISLLLARAAVRASLKRSRAKGYLQQRVLIVGDSAHIEAVSAVLSREAWLGYDVVGALAPASTGAVTASGIPVLGDVDLVAETAREAGADVVLLAGGAVTSPSRLREVAWQLEDSHVQLVVAPSVTEVSAERVRVRPVGGLPLIHLEKPRAAKAARWLKRAFDVVGVLVLIAAASPVLAAAALCVRRHDGGPVFFRQERIGRDGLPFLCFKFRTMAVNAEALLEQVLADQGQAHGVFAKLKVDPRITRPGRFLRRFSLDELPQLFNVLSGDMSLVGPRPQTAKEVALYDGHMARRLHVRPGMTGLWQVSGRSDLTPEESIRLDNYYVDNWSMVQDLSILARTVGAVVGSRGAY